MKLNKLYLLVCTSVMAFASPTSAIAKAVERLLQYEHCFNASAQKYNLSPVLLKGIALAESSGIPTAKNTNHIGTTKSVDVGLMQINSGWFPLLERKFGIKASQLQNACMSIDVGAWILAHEFKRYGNQWDAVGAYNAACTQLKGKACSKRRQAYSWRVYRMMKLVQESAPRNISG